MNGNITIKQLNLFAAVVRQGGISEAAKTLHLSPSAVSKGLTQLEENVGNQLISRSTRHSRPTAAGHQLYTQLGPILHALESALENTGSGDDEPSGQLSLTCSIAFGTAHLSDLCAAFQARYPKVSLVCTLSDKFENLRNEDYDIALRITKTPPPQYSARRIGTIEWGYFASPEYFKNNGTPQSIIDLESHFCLVYLGIDEAWSYYDPNGKRTPINFRRTSTQVNSSFVLLDSALKGRGVAYLPSYLYEPYKKTGALIQAFDNIQEKNTHHFFAVTLDESAKNPAVAAFVEFCCDWYQTLIQADQSS